MLGRADTVSIEALGVADVLAGVVGWPVAGDMTASLVTCERNQH